MNGTPHLLIFVVLIESESWLEEQKWKRRKQEKKNVELSIVMWENDLLLSNVTVKDKDKNMKKKNLENLPDLCFSAYVL